jgi:hypothetical protein
VVTIADGLSPTMGKFCDKRRDDLAPSSHRHALIFSDRRHCMRTVIGRAANS